ncbi:MAG: KpsF/GutQ family sugar-phosphate isomerase [Gammaproteobacteria bacterium]
MSTQSGNRQAQIGSIEDVRAIASKVLNIEAQAVTGLLPHLDNDFHRAASLCMQCEGRIVVTGMGKSGHIANKIAATFASTGTPAFYVHPGEASHGDMGMITPADVVVAVSNSGETGELLALLPTIKRLGVPLIAMTGKPGSTLARTADTHVNVGVEEEACPLNLAPTASTTATLAMGDALAVVLLECRGFTSEDFALSHPGGTLGKKLLMRVADVMRSGDDIATVASNSSLGEALLNMSQKGLGMTIVVDNDHNMLGVFTDGDLRRVIDARLNIHETAIGDVMIRDCKSANPNMMAAEAVHVMETHRITALPVIDDGNKVVGALNIHDLFRAGVV